MHAGEDKDVAAIAEATPNYLSSEESSPETSLSERSFPDTVPDHPTEIEVPVPKLSDQPCTERKFNLVLYGVQESPEGTNRYDQIESDTENVVKILHKISPSITDLSIRGCFRIGKFSPTKTRPLIVVFLRVQDVCLIL